MAFNPFVTFQKNKRFWMAAILMVCMVTFVFCTGMRGDMSDRFLRIFGKSGPTVARVGGYSLSNQDLHELKMQRNFANEFILNCSDLAYRNLTKAFYEMQKKDGGEKDKKETQARRQKLAELEIRIRTLAFRKNKTRYFDTGVKFDDLLEFKLWQVQADKMGVRLEEDHVDFLFRMEFFDELYPEQLQQAQAIAARNFQNANHAFVRKAITEEFRVRIAQYAVLGAQPFSYFLRARDENLRNKFGDPSIPEEVRAPMSLAQIHDYFHKKRAEFNVTLIPVHVKDYEKQIKESPTEIEQRSLFDQLKNKPADPNSDEFGLERLAQIKIEYLIADPMAPGYLDLARAIAALSVTNPIAFDPFQSPLATAARYGFIAQKHAIDIDNHYQAMATNMRPHNAALLSERDVATPILDRLSSRHPEAVASLVAANALTAMHPLDGIGATAGYLAWGATKHPDEFEAAMRSEVSRRKNAYASLFGAAASPFPLEVVPLFLGMDRWQEFPLERNVQLFLEYGPWRYVHPRYTTETMQHEIKEILIRRTAEEWAQANIKQIRKELEGAAGDAEKFKRVLNKYVKELKLTYGPSDDKRAVYHNRFSIGEAKEYETLRKAFEKDVDLINFYEGRDMTPGRVLKAGDFQKMFFDSTEGFSSTALYRAMTWPPEVKPSPTRMWKAPDPRLVRNITAEEEMRLRQHLIGQDPNKAVPTLDLFSSAAKPILFWRTAETAPQRYNDFTKLLKDLEQIKADRAKLEDEIKKSAKEPTAEAKKNLDDLKKSEADILEVQNRIIEGWRFDRARNTQAIPEAKAVAKKLIDAPNPEGVAIGEASRLKHDSIPLPGLAQLYAERFGQTTDYSNYPMPMDKLLSPREDMLQQVLSLANLKEPIKTGNKELDDVNKELFEQVNKQRGKLAAGYHVQILTNKPRNIYYVALVVKAPAANDMQLKNALTLARHTPHGPRDLFVEKAQQEFAKQYRAEIVASLGRTLGYEVVNADTRKEFDERVGD